MRRIGWLIGMLATGAAAATPSGTPTGWWLEEGVNPPGYAATAPLRTDANIDTVVLMCEAGTNGRVLQLQLYLTEEGPLLPVSRPDAEIKADPRAELVVDGLTFTAEILFADAHVVLADSRDDAWPALSPALVDAMGRGTRLTLRFDLIGDSSIDGSAVIDLAAGRDAIAAVRRCVAPGMPNVAEAPR